jgi:4-aminobutyrate aminotransferase-like enzyme
MAHESILSKRKEFFPASLYASFKNPLIVERGKDHFYTSPDYSTPVLDLYNNVSHIGHSHPAVMEAVLQAYSEININTRYLHPSLTSYAEQLGKYFPPQKKYKVLFTNSGSEANDLALQIAWSACMHYGRPHIGSLEGSYHGTSWLCDQASHLTSTGIPKSDSTSDDGSNPPIDLIKFLPFDPNESKTNSQSCFETMGAVIVEPIQGVAGNRTVDHDWLKQIRVNSPILICDEVQTGFGRSGKTFFAFEKAEILPDIITCGKPMANGYPMGACIMSEDVLKFLPRTYFNTFGGSSASCMVASAVLKEIEKQGIVMKCQELGEFLKSELASIEMVDRVTGDGLFIGVRLMPSLSSRSRQIVETLKNRGIVVGIGFHDTIRIKPPTTVEKDDLRFFAGVLRDVICDSMKNASSE